VGPEVWGATVFEDAFGKRATPLEGVLGAHYLFGEHLQIGAGIGTGLTRGYGAPEARVLMGISWVEHPASTPSFN
jgi:hypothetical protein